MKNVWKKRMGICILWIYGLDKNNNGEVDHFVSDIGNGKYYDPYNETVGNISDFQKNNWNVQTRYMNYELQK